eukprot:scaffold14703_cov50-Phaeocystis_antarctica.AAC.3
MSPRRPEGGRRQESLGGGGDVGVSHSATEGAPTCFSIKDAMGVALPSRKERGRSELTKVTPSPTW